MPSWLTAAVIRVIHRARNSRLRVRRSRVANARARTSVSLTVRNSLLRPPTLPRASLNGDELSRDEHALDRTFRANNRMTLRICSQTDRHPDNQHPASILALSTGAKSIHDDLCFSTTNQPTGSQISLALRTFVAEQVTARRLAMSRLARRRNLKTAFHSLMCLLLWHFYLRDFHQPP